MLSSKKRSFEQFLEPLIRILSGANPNILTLIGIIPPILFFVFVINKLYLLAIFAFIGNLFDLIDGMVARKYNKVTKFGGLLDSTFDRISDFLVISAFAFGGIIRWEITVPLLLVSFLISYIRSRGESANHNVSFAIGLIERTERLILLAGALIMYVLFPRFILYGFNSAEIIFLILLTLSLYTVLQRTLHAYKTLK